MRKALVYGPLDLRIVDLPERAPGPGEVKAKMLVTMLTTANVRIYSGSLVADLTFPATLSYTGVAEVAEVGPGVTTFRPGDLVYPNFYRACLECRWCRADKLVACETMPLGAHNMMVGEQYESGLQESIIFPEKRFYRVRPGARIEAVAMAGFLSVAMQAITAIGLGDWEHSNPDRDTLFVNGAGPIGWSATQLARLSGTRVVAAEIRPTRMERARQMGADVVVDANRPDAKQRIVEACGGPPVLVVEATGTETGAALAYDVAGRGARIAGVGVSAYPITQHFLILKGLSVYGIGGAVRVQETIDLIADGKIDISAAISHRYPFSRLKDAIEFKRTTPEAELVAVYVDEARMPS